MNTALRDELTAKGICISCGTTRGEKTASNSLHCKHCLQKFSMINMRQASVTHKDSRRLIGAQVSANFAAD